MTGVCVVCGQAHRVPSTRGSRLANFRSPCHQALMKAPPRKPRGMPYTMWSGDYAAREELARRWKAGEITA